MLFSVDSLSSIDTSDQPSTLTATVVANITFPKVGNFVGGRPKPLIELRFSAANLANSDLLSLSDPFAVIYVERDDRVLEELGRTETVVDDLSPSWTAALVIPASARNSQLIIDVYDRDGASYELRKHDHLGRARVHVADVLSAPRRSYAALLTSAQNVQRRTNLLRVRPKGMLRVMAEEVANFPSHKIELRVQAAALRKNGRRRDVVQFYEISRARGSGWCTVYRSEDGKHVDRYGYIRFRPARMTERLLHNGDEKRPLRVSFYTRQTRRAHELLGFFQVNGALDLKQRQTMPLKGDAMVVEEGSMRMSSLSAVTSESECANGALGQIYIEDVSEVDDVTAVTVLCDHVSNRNHTSLAEDTTVPERVVRRMPSFISLH